MNGNWFKIKNKELPAAETLLRENEDEYVSACGRFLSMVSPRDTVWTLREKKDEIKGLLISSKSTIIPVLCGRKEIPSLDFLKRYIRAKKIHSAQGLKEEVLILEKELEKIGAKIVDIFDYELMTLDKSPDKTNFTNFFPNLVLRVPNLTDLDAMTPLQEGYEKEEVLPKGSAFHSMASRINLSNIIAEGKILAAELNGQLVGKINVSSVSFSRYLVGGVYVLPAFRGKGIARRMTAEFIESLVKEGRGVTLFVKKNNQAARRLYTGLGFTVKGDYRITYY